MYKVAAVARVDDEQDTSTGAFERAGFEVERVGKSTVFERDVSPAVVEATRALIGSNGNGYSRRDANNAPAESPASESGEKHGEQGDEP